MRAGIGLGCRSRNERTWCHVRRGKLLSCFWVSILANNGVFSEYASVFKGGLSIPCKVLLELEATEDSVDDGGSERLEEIRSPTNLATDHASTIVARTARQVGTKRLEKRMAAINSRTAGDCRRSSLRTDTSTSDGFSVNDMIARSSLGSASAMSVPDIYC